MVTLSADDRLRIEAAIEEAERHTAGEIVVVVTRQAASYRSVPLAYALFLALLTPWCLLPTSLGFGTILVAQGLVAALAAGLLGIGRARVAAVPRGVRRARAREAAEREFRARGLASTRGRTGVLIHVAIAERHAEVVADLAVATRVDPAIWRTIVEALVSSLGRGETREGLTAAVARVGAVLAEHLPPGSADTDELPNRVIVL